MEILSIMWATECGHPFYGCPHPFQQVDADIHFIDVHIHFIRWMRTSTFRMSASTSTGECGHPLLGCPHPLDRHVRSGRPPAYECGHPRNGCPHSCRGLGMSGAFIEIYITIAMVMVAPRTVAFVLATTLPPSRSHSLRVCFVWLLGLRTPGCNTYPIARHDGPRAAPPRSRLDLGCS